jgi:hypothetical protein
MVAAMAEHYAVYRSAAETLRQEGRVITTHTGARKTNPLVAVEKQAFDCYARGFKELKIRGEPTAAAPDDEFTRFLNDVPSPRPVPPVPPPSSL